MNKRAIAVLVGMLLALAGAVARMPLRGFTAHHLDADGQVASETFLSIGAPAKWIWMWERDSLLVHSPGDTSRLRGEIDWPLLLIEQALILLVGGGLLSVAVWRKQRRSAATGLVPEGGGAKRRILAVVLLTLTGLAVCGISVPQCFQEREYFTPTRAAIEIGLARGVTPPFRYGPWVEKPSSFSRGVHYDWFWEATLMEQEGLWASDLPRPITSAIRPMWTWVIAIEGLLLLLGGGLLTAVVRRERRRIWAPAEA